VVEVVMNGLRVEEQEETCWLSSSPVCQKASSSAIPVVQREIVRARDLERTCCGSLPLSEQRRANFFRYSTNRE
jgi:hypothetical protein